MHSLILFGLLGATPLAAEPVHIQVETHILANRSSSKSAPQAPDLARETGHAMQARIGNDGRIIYDCDSAGSAIDFRFDTRAARKER